jgi:hypothetical protein
VKRGRGRPRDDVLLLRPRTRLALPLAQLLQFRPAQLDPVRHGRAEGARECGVERHIDRGEIFLEQVMRDLLRAGNGVEAVAPGVFRQQIRERHVDAEQCVHAAFIFETRQSARPHAALSRNPRGIGCVQGGAQLLHKRPTCRRIRPRLGFRRHLAGLHAVEHVHPMRERLGHGDIARKRSQIEPAFFHVGVVAVDAVRLRELMERGRERGGSGAARAWN